MTIINEDSRVVAELETSLTDNVRVIIYDCHMFIVQTTGVANSLASLQYCSINYDRKKFYWTGPEMQNAYQDR
jgi:hypothetical protein